MKVNIKKYNALLRKYEELSEKYFESVVKYDNAVERLHKHVVLNSGRKTLEQIQHEAKWGNR